MLFSDFEINGNVYTNVRKLYIYSSLPVEEDLSVYYKKNDKLMYHVIDFSYGKDGVHFKSKFLAGKSSYFMFDLNRMFHYLRESV